MTSTQKAYLAFQLSHTKEASSFFSGASRILPVLGKSLLATGQRVLGSPVSWLGSVTRSRALRGWGATQGRAGRLTQRALKKETGSLGGFARGAIGTGKFVGGAAAGAVPFAMAEKAILPNAEENMAAGFQQGQAQAAEQFSQMPFYRRAMASDPNALFQNFLQQQSQAAANPFQNNRGRY